MTLAPLTTRRCRRGLHGLVLLAGPLQLLSGCGSSGPASPAPIATSPAAASTAVTLFLTGAASDQQTQVQVGLTGVTLTNQAGKQVSLSVPAVAGMTSFPSPDFIQLNGNSEPVLTSAVADDTYVSATVSLSGGSQFTCAAQVSGTATTATYAFHANPSQVAASLSAPITISGAAMGLALSLNVPKSLTYPNCVQTGLPTYSITPVFSLAPVSFEPGASNPIGLSETAITGLVTSSGGSTGDIAIETPQALTITAATGANTIYQGVASAAGVAAGQAATLDLTVQSDGSLLASRVAVPTTSTTQLTTYSGPLTFVSDAQPSADLIPVSQGFLFPSGSALGAQPFSFGSASFLISAAPQVLAGLPFTPVFNAQTAVPGQNVLVTTNSSGFQNGPIYVPASTVSLEVQTIDGQIAAAASSGAFAVYTTSISPLSVFSQFGAQAGQAALIASPGQVVVYVGPNTQHVTSAIPVAGGVLRFSGYIFNDNGVLRMACTSISDGVPQ